MGKQHAAPSDHNNKKNVNKNENNIDIKFLTYNVNGLFDKLENDYFVEFISSFDFICLTETFVANDFQSPQFDDFVTFTSKARKLSRQGRYSGGVIVMIRKSLASFVERIPVDTGNTVVIKISKTLFSTSKDIMYICSYVPPNDSPYWKSQDDCFGIEVLENCILDLHEVRGDFYILLNGDLNARTACENYSFNADVDVFEEPQSSDQTHFPRKSQDSHMNGFGEYLIELCNTFDCIILNGLCDKEFDDSCTYVSSSGISTVDYFLLSYELFSTININSFSVGNITESDHLPVSMEIQSQCMDTGIKQSEESNTDKYDKFV